MKRSDIRGINPTEAMASFVFTTNGGGIAHDKAEAIRDATIRAFAEACAANNLEHNVEVTARSMQPVVFERVVSKKFGPRR